MCTVTFVPTNPGLLFTSSRDESSQRAAALAPATYVLGGKKLVFPKDPDASGSWIAMQENGKFAVLLNGAFIKHQPALKYRLSRGQILLDLVVSSNMNFAFRNINLENIEPFTIILLEDGKLTENKWDGANKHTRELPAGEAHIWSSVTLYEPEVILERERWFRNWCNKTPNPSVGQILEFHLNAGNGDECNQIRMNRGGVKLTVSITCMEIRSNKPTMHYVDLADDTRSKTAINFSTAPVSN